MRGIVAATSRSAEFFGEAEGDPVTDFVLRFLFGDKEAFEANFLPDADSAAHRLVEGFALGMNRHLRETGVENLPEGESGCRDADWVFEIDATDLWMLLGRIPLKGSSDEGIVRRAIFNTTGPSPGATSTFEEADQAELAEGLGRLARALGRPGHGSNALAVGSDLSQSGKGLLLANPHRSWTGDGSFYQVHLTLPGEYDVAGAALQGLPWIGIGFNADLAWTHTTSFATRFTLYELELNPDNLLQYRYEGEWRDITTKDIAIQVKGPDGTLEERTHTFYRSHFGPVINLKELNGLFDPWPLANGSVLALRDANEPRAATFFDQYRSMGQASNLDEFTEALKPITIPVFHTLAADRHGEAFYGEVAVVPHVTQAQLDGCLTRIGQLLAGLSKQRGAGARRQRGSLRVGRGCRQPARHKPLRLRRKAQGSHPGLRRQQQRQLLAERPQQSAHRLSAGVRLAGRRGPTTNAAHAHRPPDGGGAAERRRWLGQRTRLHPRLAQGPDVHEPRFRRRTDLGRCP